jgi:hypothetical protein
MLRRAMDLGGFHQVTMRGLFGNWRTGYCQLGDRRFDLGNSGNLAQETLLLTSPSVASLHNSHKS